MESGCNTNFSTGGFIEVLAPSKNGNELDRMKHEAEKRGVDIRNVFGDETTTLQLCASLKVLLLTPRDLPCFLPTRNGANSVLLILKRPKEPFRGGLFSFDRMVPRFSRWRPGTRQDGHCGSLRPQDHKIELYIGSEPAAKSKPSQTDINQNSSFTAPASPSQ